MIRAVAYIRVSDSSQVDGHSLDAQERAFYQFCQAKGWEPVGVYREEGKSAHSDSIRKRPRFRALLDEAAQDRFDVAVCHTLDRWSRNLQVMLESLTTLDRHNKSLVSITENIDYASPEGRLVTRTLGSFAEFFSDSLAKHVKKGVGERALKGLHLGGIPFGYQSCWEEVNKLRQPRCQPEHPGAVHIHPQEGTAVQQLFQKYASGQTTLSQLAQGLNSQGFRTRNMHKLEDGQGNIKAGPRLFTTASVRGILHNPFYTGKVRHHDQLLPGSHEPLVSPELFHQVQLALKKNSGRSRTLQPHPAREYLLKGLVRCGHCGYPMWSQTYTNGHRYYREQRGSRGAGYCVGRSGSLPCEIPDGQMDRIIQAIALPESWQDRMLGQLHLADEVERVAEERRQTEQRLKRLGQVYLDGLLEQDDYRRQKRQLEERLHSLVVPGVNAVQEAGKLLESLPQLWAEATLGEKRQILLSMLEAVYVDPVEEKAIVAIKPKPAFLALFNMVETRSGSAVALITQKNMDGNETVSEVVRDCTESVPCSWWRRGRVELPVQKAPQSDILQACPAFKFSPQGISAGGTILKLSDFSLAALYRHRGRRSPDLWRLLPRLQAWQRADVAAVRPLVRIHVRRLLFATSLTSPVAPRLAIPQWTLLSNPRVPIANILSHTVHSGSNRILSQRPGI